MRRTREKWAAALGIARISKAVWAFPRARPEPAGTTDVGHGPQSVTAVILANHRPFTNRTRSRVRQLTATGATNPTPVAKEASSASRRGSIEDEKTKYTKTINGTDFKPTSPTNPTYSENHHAHTEAYWPEFGELDARAKMDSRIAIQDREWTTHPRTPND